MKSTILIFILIILSCGNKNAKPSAKDNPNYKLDSTITVVPDTLYKKESLLDSSISYLYGDFNIKILSIVGIDTSSLYLAGLFGDKTNELFHFNFKLRSLQKIALFPKGWNIQYVSIEDNKIFLNTRDSIIAITFDDHEEVFRFLAKDVRDIYYTANKRLFYTTEKYNTYVASDDSLNAEGSLIGQFKNARDSIVYLFDTYNASRGAYDYVGKVLEFNINQDTTYTIFDFLALDGAFVSLNDSIFIITEDEEFSDFIVHKDGSYKINLNKHLPELATLNSCYSAFLAKSGELIIWGCNGMFFVVNNLPL